MVEFSPGALGIATGETPDQSAGRIAYEADRIAKSQASVAAGRTVSLVQVREWANSLGTDYELPVPRASI